RVLSHEMDSHDPHDETSYYRLKVPKGVEVFEINGPFFFGIAHEFEETSRVVAEKPKIRILRLRHVPFINSTVLQSLRQVHANFAHHGIGLILVNVHSQPLQVLKQSGLYDSIGADNMITTIEEALTHAGALLN